MNASTVTRLFAALTLLALSGCASLSRNECLSANWEDVGIRDGANGRPEEYLIQHSKACAKAAVVPDRGAWTKGREQGLERFCVPHRAYQIGEYGAGFDSAICRNFDQDRLIAAYQHGREVNRLAGELSSIDSEMANIRVELEREDLKDRERVALAFRLGQLVYQRSDLEQSYENARYQARNL
jgi:hypothetical protein